MPRTYSRSLQAAVNATSGEAPRVLLEITHPGLAQPVRVVNDTQDLTSGGHLFVGLGFRITLPDDQEGRLPSAQLAVDNVGRELVQWLEVSNGGAGAQCRLMQVMRSAPDTIEWEITMELSHIVVTTPEVSGTLGFEDLLNRPGCAMRYDPTTAPGLF